MPQLQTHTPARRSWATTLSAVILGTSLGMLSLPEVPGSVAAAASPPSILPTNCTNTWVGTSPGGGVWLDPSNWSTGTLPTATDVACIGGGVGTILVNGTPGQTLSVGSIFVDAGSTLNVGATIVRLEDSATTSVISNLVNTATYGAIDGPGPIDIPTGGSWSWAASALHGSTLTIEAGATATIDLSRSSSDLYRHVINHGAITISSVGSPSYATSQNFNFYRLAGDAGGSIDSDGSVTIDATQTDLYLGERWTGGWRFSAASRLIVQGSHLVEFQGLGLLDGNVDIAGTAFVTAGYGSGSVSAAINVPVGATFGLVQGTYHVTGLIRGAGAYCPAIGETILDNPAALQGIALVDTGACGGRSPGAGSLTMPRGSAGSVHRLITSADTTIGGGGELTVVGDGDPATEDATFGSSVARSGLIVQDATLVLAPGTTTSLGGGSNENLAEPAPTAPVDAVTAIINHGTLLWHNAYVTGNPRTRFENAADGTVIVDAGPHTDRGNTAIFDGLDGSFVNLGHLVVTTGEFAIDGRRNPATSLAGQIDVQAGAALSLVLPHITGTLRLAASSGALPGGIAIERQTLGASQTFTNDGTILLGRGAQVQAGFDYVQGPNGHLYVDVAGPLDADHGLVVATGSLQLDGLLDVTAVHPFTPLGGPVDIARGGTVPPANRTGTFSSFSGAPPLGGSWAIDYGPNSAFVTASGLSPSIVSAASFSTGVGPARFQVTASAPATFAAIGLPAGLAITADSGVISGSIASPGTYDVVLTATNDFGSSSQSFTLIVLPSDAVLTVTQAPQQRYTATIDVAMASYGSLTSPGWSVAFGDGTSQSCTPTGLARCAPIGTLTHAYGTSGTFDVTVVITDGDVTPVELVRKTMNVTLVDHAPIVHTSYTPAPADRFAPATITLDLSGTTDPDGLADLSSWNVSISDGTTTTAGPSGTSDLFLPHSFLLPGSPTVAIDYTVTVTVKDVDGVSTAISEVITVSPVQVSAGLSFAPDLTIGRKFSVLFTPDAAGAISRIATFTINFGDGRQVSGAWPAAGPLGHTYGSAGPFNATLELFTADGTSLATSTITVTPQNRAPVAVLRLSTVGLLGFTTPIYASDAPPTGPINVQIPSATGPPFTDLQLDVGASSDPDGNTDLSSWSYIATIRQPNGATGPFASAVARPFRGGTTDSFGLIGDPAGPTDFTVAVTVFDASGATSVRTVTIHVTVGSPNRPPIAVLAYTSAHSVSGGVVSLDGSKSFDPDEQVGDVLSSWKVDLVDLDGFVAPMASGSGTPPRAIPITLPNDARGGVMFARLTVIDRAGASSQTIERIFFNDCVSATVTEPNPVDISVARALEGTPTGPAALLTASLSQGLTSLPAGSTVATSPVTVRLTDSSFTRGTAPIVTSELADVSGNGQDAMYSNGGPLDIVGTGRVATTSITIVNNIGIAVPFTFGLLVTDANGVQSRHLQTIIVLPPSSPVASITATQSTSNPAAEDYALSARNINLASHGWAFSTSGTGNSDVARLLPPGTPITTQTVVVPRPAGAAVRTKVAFTVGSTGMDSDAATVTVCRDIDLPILTQLQANKPPTLTVTPAIQHTTGAATVQIKATDPDPAPLGDLAQQLTGFGPSDLVGLRQVLINGVTAAGINTTYVPGQTNWNFSVPIPAATTAGVRTFTVVADDFFAGSTTTTFTVYDDPPTLPIDNATLSLTAAPPILVRGLPLIETVSVSSATAINDRALVAIDVPADVTVTDVRTRVQASTTIASALTGAAGPVGDRWSCSSSTDVGKTRIICSILSLSSTTPSILLTLSSTTPKQSVALVAGATQVAAPLVFADQLASLSSIVSPNSLRLTKAHVLSVAGVTANAGPDQTVPDVTINPDGSRAQTQVTLDGSGSATDGRALTYQWRQTQGPLVTWVSPFTGTGAAIRVAGQKVQFATPPVTTTTTVTLELQVTAPATSTLSAQTFQDIVNVTITPPADRAPVVTGLVTTPDASSVTPAAGATLAMVASGSDPDGDPVTFAWSAWRGTGPTGTAIATTAGTGTANRSLVWPAGLSQATVRVTASDGRGQSAVRQFVLGVPTPPVTLAIAGTINGAAVGVGVTPTAPVQAAVELNATTNRTPSGGVRWTLVSGPPPSGVVFPVNATTLRFTAPPTTQSGQQLLVRATATDTSGTVTADQTIALTAVPPPSVAITVWPGNGTPPAAGSGLLDPLQPVLVPVQGLFSASAVASGTGALTYAWSVTPTAIVAAPSAATTTMTAPNNDSFLTVTVKVTDSTGASAQASRLVQVGAGLPTTNLSCGANPVFNDLIGQARDNANRVGQKLDVTIPLGSPPIGTIDLGPIAFTGDCNAAPAISFTGATMTLFGGVMRTDGGSGTVGPDTVCFTSGQLSLPAELGLGSTAAASAANPLCVPTDPTSWGQPDPAIPGSPPPDPAAPPRAAPGTAPPDQNGFRLPTITCPSGAPTITGGFNWQNVFPAMSLGNLVPKQTTARFNCGFLEVTATASTPWGDLAVRGLVRRDGSFDATVVTKGLRLFGATSNTELTGTLKRSASGQITWSASADLTAPTLGIDAMSVSSIHVELGSSGVSIAATGQVHLGSGPTVSVGLTGALTGQDEFAASFMASLTSPWTVTPGLTLSSASLAGSISRKAGVTLWDVAVGASGDWVVISPSLTVKQIVVRLSNRAARPDCAIASGTTWLSVDGTAHLAVGASAPAIDIAVNACLGLTVPSVSLSATANLNSWKPVPSVDFTLSSVGLTAQLPAGGTWTIDVTGNANYAGVALTGRVRFLPTTGTLVLDAGGDLSSLHLGPLSSGHIVFTSSPVTGYVAAPLPNAPAAAPIDLITGITAFGDINLDPSIQTAINKIINPPAPKPPVVPIPQTIRFTAQLGASTVRLKGSISFPPGKGITLFSSCPTEAPHVNAECMPTHPLTTSLQLTTLFISIDLSGKFGFGGEGDLQLASSDGVTPASKLHVVTEATIDLTGPAVTLALYFTGDWVNAMGINGLTLSNLAIQGGISFVSYPPIPTIGFGATVKSLPTNIASMLGIQTDKQEPMTFVLNIAPTKPILQISLGQPDGHTFLKPVQPISAANADALTIDYASLVFAPLGGDVGPYHYEPGISVGFAGSLLGVTASGAARLTLSPPNLHADLDVGDISFGSGANATVIKATHLLFDATPTAVNVEASGGVAIAGGPDAALALKVNATTVPPAASALFSLDVNNWVLPFGAVSIPTLHVSGSIVGALGSLPSASLVASGQMNIGSVSATLGGTVGVTNGRLTAMNVTGNVSALNLGGIVIGGPGCDGTGPQTGVCVRAGFNGAQVPSLQAGFAGSVTAAGRSLDISASFGPTGAHATGTLAVPEIGSPTITGDLWFGSGLAGLTALDVNGVSRTVHAGDFRFTGSAGSFPAPLAGSSVSLDLGRIGGVAWIQGAGALALSGRQLANGHIQLNSTGASADGDFAVANPVPGGAPLTLSLGGSVTFPTATTQTGFTLTGAIAPQSSAADPSLRVLAQGSFLLSRGTATGAPTVFTLTGSASLPGLAAASFHGIVSSAGAFCANFAVTILAASGTASMGSSCANPGLTINVSVGGFAFSGRMRASGTLLTASFNDTRELMIIGTHSYSIFDGTQVQDWVRFVTSVNGSLAWSNSGFSLTSSFSASGRVIWEVRRASNGAVYVTNFDATLGVSLANGQLCATIPGSPINPVCI